MLFCNNLVVSMYILNSLKYLRVFENLKYPGILNSFKILDGFKMFNMNNKFLLNWLANMLSIEF